MTDKSTAFVLVHGAWSGGGRYARVAALLRARIHGVHAEARPDRRAKSAEHGECCLRFFIRSRMRQARQSDGPDN